MMRIFAALLLIVLMTGCASLQNAGNFSATIEPFKDADGKVICCRTQFADGKQYAAVKATAQRSADGAFTASFEAQGVEAFQGQQIAAQATQAAIEAAAKAAAMEALAPILPALAPAAGAALAAPGAASAAAGAAAAISAEKLMAPSK